MLKSLGATLQEDERAGIYLTNALTGWEPVTSKPLPFPELEEERKKADKVKQKAPILVILGNPPYNGFAGMAQELPEEREPFARIPEDEKSSATRRTRTE